MPRLIVIGGTWASTPKPSGYMNKLTSELRKAMPGWVVVEANGLGDFNELENLMRLATGHDAILWAANVDNAETKILPYIKQIKPDCILIESKRNDGYKYKEQDLIAHMLKNHANLMLEFIKCVDGVIAAKVRDPLGNLWLDTCYSPAGVARALGARIDRLKKFTRMRSEKLGDSVAPMRGERLNYFLSQVRELGQTFHDLIHGAQTDRFLGNYAFRCIAGFPAFRDWRRNIYVSPRNVDKRGITPEDLVEVQIRDGKLGYYGDRKPSVDAPIQIALFNAYPEIRFMLHSHVYVSGAWTTGDIIPCGCLEEVEAIRQILTDSYLTHAAINLRGHGSLIMMGLSQLGFLKNIKFEARPLPEIQG